MSDQHQNSEITELHRLRRELHEEQERVQRLSAQLSTNVRYLFSIIYLGLLTFLTKLEIFNY